MGTAGVRGEKVKGKSGTPSPLLPPAPGQSGRRAEKAAGPRYAGAGGLGLWSFWSSELEGLNTNSLAAPGAE